MSSHREAPETSKDPVADNTDVYAFVSPDKPSTVTMIANFVPFQNPEGGPNFYEFGDDVRYEINVSNAGTAEPDVTFQFSFTTTVEDENTFLYNTGPITSLTDSTWNKRQSYSVAMIKGGQTTWLGDGLACPPCNIGTRSTPNYAKLAESAVHKLAEGITVFAGQRAEGFFVDLGSVFDLLALRPFQNLIAYDPTKAAAGVDATEGLNVHSIAIQVPKWLLTANGSNPSDATSASSVIGVWATASRQMTRVYDTSKSASYVDSGPYVQVSRLGMPLINEVLIPMADKDFWNASAPADDKQFAANYANPEVSSLLPALYPNVFPALATLDAAKTARADLEAILLTGLPPGVVKGFQNYTGATQADMLRLNMAVPPTAKPNPVGLLAGDAAGFPNGRRVEDDVVAIELRALAGLTYALVDKNYTPDAAASLITDGTTNSNGPYLSCFPYLGVPNGGSEVVPESA